MDQVLSFISKNSGTGSAIIFDYYPQSVVDGSCELEAGKNLYSQLAQYGEPLRFGINDVEAFLASRVFSQIRNVTGEDLKKIYFCGVNKDRAVSSLLSFAYAVAD